MARFIKTKKETIGLSPDILLFRGEKKSDYVKLRVIDFDSDNLNEIEVKNISEALRFEHSKTTSWFNIDGLHDEKIMQEISEGFNLESLIISDVLNTHTRTKINEYDNCIYVSIKMLQYNEKDDHISSENFVLIIKEKILLSFRETERDIFEPVKVQLRKNKKRIRTSGTDYLAFALLDIVIDNYLYIISCIGEKIESIEDDLMNNPMATILEEINKYKGEINYLRMSIIPCQEMISNMVKMDSELLHESVLVHLKELKDNINLAKDSLDSYREILSDQLSVFQTTVSNKLNYIMKFLTIFSVVFIPLTFIAGIYGTNFDNIPELHYKYSYFIMWGVIIAIAISMIIYFQRKKWF